MVSELNSHNDQVISTAVIELSTVSSHIMYKELEFLYLLTLCCSAGLH